MPTFVSMAELIDFLKDNKEHLRFSRIEQDTELYQGVLSKAVNDTEYRRLTDDQEKAVFKYLKNMKGKLDKLFADSK